MNSTQGDAMWVTNDNAQAALVDLKTGKAEAIPEGTIAPSVVTNYGGLFHMAMRSDGMVLFIKKK